MSFYYMPGNFYSRCNRKITGSREPLSVVRLMPSNDPVQVSILCGGLDQSSGDNTTYLELIPQPGYKFHWQL